MRLARMAVLAVCALTSPALFAQCDLKPFLPPSKDPAAFETALYKFLENDCYAAWTKDKDLRDTGPVILGNNFGTHPAIRIYYSKEAVDWLNKPKETRGEMPENAIIVKEQHTPPASENNSISGWTTMVRDSKGAWDGWYWSFHAMPSCGLPKMPPCPPADLPNPINDTTFPDSGFGNYCVNCHASADNTAVTFIDKRNINGNPMTYFVFDPSMSDPTAEPKHTTDLHAKHSAEANPMALHAVPPVDAGLLAQIAPGKAIGRYPDFPGETWDHIVAGPRPKGPQQFITSDQCIGCHDATQNSSSPPNMIYPASGGDQLGAQFINNYTAHDPTYNLSPYGEWRASMMGLAGRDPVFFAQLASERTIHDQKDLPVTIQNLCFRCHGVMGKRQLDIDTGGKEPFLADIVYKWGSQPMAKYAALARDGISCAVCHHIAADGLGKPQTFTGEFKVGPANEVNGPYEKPPTVPMDQGLGMKPVQAAQIKSSALCGSCHAINLPIYDKNGNQVGSEYEQATYLEWLNSVFQNEIKPLGSDPKTCQDCHMPQNFKMKGFEAQDLAYRIASIEDNTFPFVDNRAPDPDITLPVRTPYSRHMLGSMNLFVLKMFEQFNNTLGVRSSDPMATFGAPVSGLTLSKASGLQLAHEQTVKVEILSTTKTATTLDVKVRLTNLAGHAFPSGVSFRRAFIDFGVYDGANNNLWESGATNQYGIITDGPGGEILPTEFLIPGPDGQQQYQPHYQVITKPTQVQIYEELAKNTEGVFTTSFVALFKRVKLNRLQPRGWRKDGPYAHDTAPDANTAKDPDYNNGSGADTIVYSIPLSDLKGTPATVSATVYYQTIPPYYLRQRFTDSDLPDTSRLLDFVSRLKVAGSEVANWKLRVASVRRPVS